MDDKSYNDAMMQYYFDLGQNSDDNDLFGTLTKIDCKKVYTSNEACKKNCHLMCDGHSNINGSHNLTTSTGKLCKLHSCFYHSDKGIGFNLCKACYDELPDIFNLILE